MVTPLEVVVFVFALCSLVRAGEMAVETAARAVARALCVRSITA